MCISVGGRPLGLSRVCNCVFTNDPVRISALSPRLWERGVPRGTLRNQISQGILLRACFHCFSDVRVFSSRGRRCVYIYIYICIGFSFGAPYIHVIFSVVAIFFCLVGGRLRFALRASHCFWLSGFFGELVFLSRFVLRSFWAARPEASARDDSADPRPTL